MRESSSACSQSYKIDDVASLRAQMPATSPVSFAGQSVASGTTDPNESASPVAGSSQKFELTYDKLVIAVGAYSQSKSLTPLIIMHRRRLTCHTTAFNVPGVKEHAYFLKDIRDARRIRTRVLECERIPSTS